MSLENTRNCMARYKVAIKRPSSVKLKTLRAKLIFRKTRRLKFPFLFWGYQTRGKLRHELFPKLDNGPVK